MAKWNDILDDEDGDILIEDGDLAMGDSLDQDVATIVGLNPGEWPSDPILGPGLIRLMKGNATPTAIRQAIRLHLSRDGKNVKSIAVDNGHFIIEAEQR